MAALSWDEVVAKPEFQSLSLRDQYSARTEYLRDVIYPQVKPNERFDAMREFTAYADSVQPKRVEAPPVPEESSGLRRVGDLGIDAVKMTVGAGRGLVGLVDLVTAGHVGDFLEKNVGLDFNKTQEILSQQYGTERTQEEAQLNDAVANKDYMGMASTLFSEPAMLAGKIVENMHFVLGIQGIGRTAGKALATKASEAAIEAATKAGKSKEFIAQAGEEAFTKMMMNVTSSAEGGLVAGQVMEDIRDEKGTGYHPEALAAGIGSAAIGRVAGSVGRKIGLGDVEATLAGAKGAASNATDGLLMRGVKGFAQEGILEEPIQSAWERGMTNVATDKQFTEGMATDAVMGGVIGGVSGGAMGMAASNKSDADIRDVIMGAGDVDSAISTLEASTSEPLALPNYANTTSHVYPDGSVATMDHMESERLNGMTHQPVDTTTDTTADNYQAELNQKMAKDAALTDYFNKTIPKSAAFSQAELDARQADTQKQRELDSIVEQTRNDTVETETNKTAASGFDSTEPTAMELAIQKASKLKEEIAALKARKDAQKATVEPQTESTNTTASTVVNEASNVANTDTTVQPIEQFTEREQAPEVNATQKVEEKLSGAAAIRARTSERKLANQGNVDVAPINRATATSLPAIYANASTEELRTEIANLDAKITSAITASEGEMAANGNRSTRKAVQSQAVVTFSQTKYMLEQELARRNNTDIPETVAQVKQVKPKIKSKAGTLQGTLIELGGISTADLRDITGETKRNNLRSYRSAFKANSGKSLRYHIESGDLDQYLPYNMRLEANTATDEAYDSTGAYDYIAEKIANGEQVIPYDAQEQLNAIKYEGDAVTDVANELTEDEINGQLQQAGYEERESATDARIFDTDSQNSGTESGTGATATAQAGQDLLGDNTTAKQAVADAERAKDTRRNTGNDNAGDFTLTGSNSEADKAIANGAQNLFDATDSYTLDNDGKRAYNPVTYTKNAEDMTGEMPTYFDKHRDKFAKLVADNKDDNGLFAKALRGDTLTKEELKTLEAASNQIELKDRSDNIFDQDAIDADKAKTYRANIRRSDLDTDLKNEAVQAVNDGDYQYADKLLAESKPQVAKNNAPESGNDTKFSKDPYQSYYDAMLPQWEVKPEWHGETGKINGNLAYRNKFVTLESTGKVEHIHGLQYGGDRFEEFDIRSNVNGVELGSVTLELAGNKPVALHDINIIKRERKNGYAKKVVGALLSIAPERSMGIVEIIYSAEDFWRKSGVHTIGYNDGNATLTWNDFAEAAESARGRKGNIPTAFSRGETQGDGREGIGKTDVQRRKQLRERPRHTVESLTTALNDALNEESSGLAAILKSPIVSIINNSDIPADAKASAGQVTKAFVSKGKVYFIADNLGTNMTNQELVGLVKHEIAVHAIQLGKDDAQFKAILAQVDKMNAKTDALVPSDTPAKLKSEEKLGYLVESNPKLPIVQKFIAWLRNAIRNIGRSVPLAQRTSFFKWAESLTENDIHYMASEALKSASQYIGRSTGTDTMYSQSATADDYFPPSRDDVSLQSTTKNVKDTLLNTIASSGDPLDSWLTKFQTQLHKAIRNPHFKKVYDGVQKFLSDSTDIMMRAEEHAPLIFKKMRMFGMGQGLDGKQNAKLGSILARGTLQDSNGKFDANPHTGKVFTDAELKEMGADEKVIEAYRQARLAIAKSLSDTAVAEIIQQYRSTTGNDLDFHELKHKTLEEVHDFVNEKLHTEMGTEPITSTRHGNLLKAQQLIDGMVSKVEQMTANGYAPISRFGKYMTSGTKDGKRHLSFHDSISQAKLAANSLVKDGYKEVTSGVRSNAETMFNGVTPDTLEAFGDMMKDEWDDKTQKVYQMYLQNVVSERSALARRMEREGVEGYSTDATRGLASFITSNARMASAAINAANIRKSVNNIKKNAPNQGATYDEAVNLTKYVLEGGAGESNDVLRRTQGYMFVHYLAASVAPALVNLTATPAITYERLMQYGGATKAQWADVLTNATRNQSKDKKLVELLKEAELRGITDPAETYQLMAATSSGSASFPLFKMMRGLSYNFAITERFNRRIAYSAAYYTLENYKKKNNGAIPEGFDNDLQFYQQMVAETQGIYNKGNQVNLSRSAIGKLAFTFKQYPIMYLEFLGRSLGGKEAWYTFKGENKAGALTSLAFIFLAAGAEGLPFMENIDDLLDAIGHMLGYPTNIRSDKKKWLESMMSKEMANFMMYGASTTGLPVNIAGRMSTGRLIPAISYLDPAVKDKTRAMGELFGPAYGIIDNYATKSLPMFAKGNFDGALYSAMPLWMRQYHDAMQIGTTGEYRDANGKKVMNNPTAGDAAIRALGFQSAQLGEEGRLTNINMIDKESLAFAKTSINERYADALVSNDPAMVKDAMKEYMFWRKQYAEKGINFTLNMSAIRKRAKDMKLSRMERNLKSLDRMLRDNANKEARYLAEMDDEE